MSPKKMSEQTILDAAAEEFAEKGYDGARVDAIAKRAGINKAMLYYRVGDKEELYRRVVLRGQTGFQNAILKAMESTNTAPDTMASMLKGITENAAENRLIPSIMLREIAGNAKTLPEEGRDGLRKFMDTIRSMVTMGIEEGTFRNIDPAALQFMVTGAIFTLSLTREMRQELNPDDPGPISVEQITESIQDILLHGILKEGPEQ
ncbi:MAG: TetR/AcrR family transcriptional regulator [Candidatus Sabulitectum sp.]|nr:TetR/AcrR family transcriptional regulator [Candidatus Sabulitectum sp.]